eukprot:CAMPEP_0182439296 /NCGR_PEP_ID=MMETSP1167-20130531/86351_1 /TAXON_ID=2988 /ORGANISM="Mallomonas Sp, Strain CCMP3275" /LENGTH=582 /DNA_ID=CAMNT_0024632967 /DNA_START=852 /DNA_END=2600 /DNA_ORIENTATION=-
MCHTRVMRKEAIKHQEELEFKRMFVRYISHEVRTPLNTAIMGLQVLAEDLKASQDRESMETVSDIHRSCDVAVQVLNELLTFDKLEGGTLMLEKTEVNAMELITDIVHLFQVQARQCKVTLAVAAVARDEAELNSLKINIDVNKIAQVIRNLVSNGLKFTSTGGNVDVVVDLCDGADNEGTPCRLLKVHVTDNGAGISPENQKRLFKEIVQFNPGKLQKGGGSGLGLYISHGLIALHHGVLSVSSPGEGHGCSFTFTLPSYTDTKLRQKPFLAKNPVRGSILSVRASKFHKIANGTPGEINSNLSQSYDVRDFGRSHSHRSRSISSSNASVYIRSKASREITPRSQINLSVYGNGPPPTALHDFIVYRNTPYIPRKSFAVIHDNVSNIEKEDDADSVRSRSTAASVVVPDESFVPCKEKLVVLVVDDSSASRKMQCRLLKRRCKTCFQAENGQEAVEKVKLSMREGSDAEAIDLILMDSVMPVMDGLQASNCIRDGGYTGLIIGLTGNVSQDEIEDFLHYGADAVLPKPLDIVSYDLAVTKLLASPILDALSDSESISCKSEHIENVNALDIVREWSGENIK